MSARTSLVLAVVVVSLGSLAYRLLPLLGARRIPDRVTELAGWTGMAVLTASVVRAVLQHHDPSVPAATVVAPLVGAVAVGLGLWLAVRGRSVLLAVAAGASSYVLISGGLHVLG